MSRLIGTGSRLVHAKKENKETKRKTERKIDLFFFEYESYYNKNDEYVVHWEFSWYCFMIVGVIAASVFITFG